MADIADYLAPKGSLYWIGGDFQVESDWLLELGRIKQISGSLRVGNRRIGTCTAKTLHQPSTTMWRMRG